MGNFWSAIDNGIGSIAKATGSDKGEFYSGIFKSVAQTVQTGKPTIVTNASTATINSLKPSLNASGNGLGVDVNATLTTDKQTLNKTLLWIGGSIVLAVLLAVFLPKLIFKKRKRW